MSEFLIPENRPVFTGGFAARDAALGDLQKRPLIILSHGTGGSAFQMMWLARALVSKGFIVAAVDHHGNTAAEDTYDARGFRLPGERARDVSAVLDQLLVHPEFGPVIDAERIGAAGFSLGGHTVTALAGGRTDLARLTAFCGSEARDATCEPQAEFPEANTEFERLRGTDPRIDEQLNNASASLQDARIRSIVLLAPALGQAFIQQSLETISTTTLIFAGTADITAPAPTNALTIAQGIPNAQLRLLPDVTHYMFLNLCTERGRRYVEVCSDPAGTERAKMHDDVAAAVADHFLETLR